MLPQVYFLKCFLHLLSLFTVNAYIILYLSWGNKIHSLRIMSLNVKERIVPPALNERSLWGKREWRDFLSLF